MGILDWITDGGGSLFGGGAASTPQPDAAMPPMQRPAGMPIPPMSMQRPEFAGPPPGGNMNFEPQSRPPMPPPAAGGPQLTGDFDQNGLPPPNGAGAPPPPPMPPGVDPSTIGGPPGAGQPPVPMPQPRPAGAPPPVQNAVPPPPAEVPPGLPPTDPNQPVKYPGMGLDAAKFPPHAQSGFTPANMQAQGDAGLLGSAFGMNPHDAMMVRGSLGAGLKAAGNSAGKSPFQALTSGAGEALEGGEKSKKEYEDQSLKYLKTAIDAQKAGDTATYNTNYTKYLAAKLKADTDKAASGNAKGDSPTQLYLSAVRATNSDPTLKGYNDAIRAARASGDTAAIAKAQADLEQAKAGIMNGHLGRLKLDPQTAAQIAQQPGMNPGNAIDAGKQGITEKNIAQKLQPGQYYRNPKDGQIYQFNGGPAKGSTPDKPTTPTEPRDPNKPEKGSRASAADDSDESEG